MRAPHRRSPDWWPDKDDVDDGPQPADAPELEVEVSDNPVVATLLGPDGEVLVEVREREPIGFRIR